MTVDRSTEYLLSLFQELLNLPHETEWVEFKHNNDNPDFHSLKRKAVRVVLYKGDNRVETIREQEGSKGYASGFEGLIGIVTNLLPSNEVIGQALRKEAPMFPELAIRELVPMPLSIRTFTLPAHLRWWKFFPVAWKLPIPDSPWSKQTGFWTVHPNHAMRRWHHSCAESASARNGAVVWTKWCFRPSYISCPRPFLKPLKSIPVLYCLLTVNLKIWIRTTGLGPVTCMPV